jgi:hypothetical protein
MSIATVIRKTLRAASTAVFLAAALAGSHAMVGQVSARAASGELSELPSEELRHDAAVSRRAAKLLVQVAKSLPTFVLPVCDGRHDASFVAERSNVLSSLSGGQHALRNGLGAPLLT